MDLLKKVTALLLCLILALSIVACDSKNDRSDKDDDDEEEEETTLELNEGEKDCLHRWGEWVVLTANTCTRSGERMHTCDLCEREEVEPLVATGHMFEGAKCSNCGKDARACDHTKTKTVEVQKATCTESGRKHEICSSCDAVVNITYIDSTGHGETKTVLVKEATCFEDGQEDIVCKTCGEVVYSNTLYSYGHDMEYHEYKDPTCTEVGWYSYGSCKKCDYSEYSDNEREALGHNYIAGKCTRCAEAVSGFETIGAPGRVENPFNVAVAEKSVYDAAAATIDKFTGEFAAEGESYTYTFTAAYTGIHYIWLSDFSGTYMTFAITNALNENLYSDGNFRDTYGKSLTLTAGETYTIQVGQHRGLSKYTINVGYHKAPVDISEYGIVNDQIAFNCQNIEYTFVPEADGNYRFVFSGMEYKVNVYVYDQDNNRIAYQTYCSEGSGLSVKDVVAGNTYTVVVCAYSDSVITPYTMTIYESTVIPDITGYTSVSDSIYYNDQDNQYTFVAPYDGAYKFTISGLDDGCSVEIGIYDQSGSRKGYRNVAYNDEFATASDLIAGETYTLIVEHRYSFTPYTIDIMSPAAPIEMKNNMAVTDQLVYGGQANTYIFNVEEDGSYKIYLTDLNRYDSVCMIIYDAEGNEIDYDSGMSSMECMNIYDAKAGDVFTICVKVYFDLTPYTISIQK